MFKIYYSVPGEKTHQKIIADDFEELDSILSALDGNGYCIVVVMTYEEEE